jgi:hypothetical protein
MVGLEGVRMREVAAGRKHSLLLTEEGALWSCGCGAFGRLGHGDKQDRPMPLRISALQAVRVVQVASGSDLSFALTDAGELLSFGSNKDGGLGRGTLDAGFDPTPRRVEGLEGLRIVEAGAGGCHSLAVTEDGALFSWGCGDNMASSVTATLGINHGQSAWWRLRASSCGTPPLASCTTSQWAPAASSSAGATVIQVS